MDFEFVTVPDFVDKTIPIMPRRTATDGRICGIDPAWLLEQLGRRSALRGNSPMHNLADRPAAADVAQIRRDITAYATSAVSSRLARKTATVNMGDYPAPVDAPTFSYDMDELEPGQPIKRVHTAENFAALSAIGRHFPASPTESDSAEWRISYKETYYPYGGGSETRDRTGTYCFYHSWTANGITGNWTETTTANFAVDSSPSATFGTVTSAWVASPVRLAQFKVTGYHQTVNGSVTDRDKEWDFTCYQSLVGTLAAGGVSSFPYGDLLGMAAAAISAAGAADMARTSPPDPIIESFSLAVNVYLSDFIFTLSDDCMP